MTHRVAVIPGDGAGPEVVAEARKAVDALGLGLEWTELDWGTNRYLEQGALMPPDASRSSGGRTPSCSEPSAIPPSPTM
jgi:tartrate dehydrogenase/decarboxylase / D-malate dehydrogenase